MNDRDATLGERSTLFQREMERRDRAEDFDEAIPISEVADLLQKWDGKSEAPPLSGLARLASDTKSAWREGMTSAKGKGKEVETEVRPLRPGSGLSVGGVGLAPFPPMDLGAGGTGTPPLPPAFPGADGEPSDSSSSSDEEDRRPTRKHRRSRYVQGGSGITTGDLRSVLSGLLEQSSKPRPKRLSLQNPGSILANGVWNSDFGLQSSIDIC